jgi:hypothetical protein
MKTKNVTFDSRAVERARGYDAIVAKESTTRHDADVTTRLVTTEPGNDELFQALTKLSSVGLELGMTAGVRSPAGRIARLTRM